MSKALIPIPKWISTAGERVKGAWRIASSVGPALVSDKIVSHSARMAEVGFLSSLLQKEAESLGAVRAKLWSRYGNCTGEKRWRILNELRQLDADMRRVGIINKAFLYFPETATGGSSKTHDGPINGHWLSVFQQLSAAENEPWRQDLLARALAIEATKPGSISARALWNIGTFTEMTFHSLAYILDCCTWIRSSDGFQTPIIPCRVPWLSGQLTKGFNATREYKIGSLIFYLQECSLLGDVFNCFSDLLGDTYDIIYADQSFKFIWPEENGRYPIPGLMPSGLGREIALLYTPQRRDLGQDCYNNLVTSLKNAIKPKTKKEMTGPTRRSTTTRRKRREGER